MRVVTSDARCKREIIRRIGLSKDIFSKLQYILTDRKLSLHIKIRFVRNFCMADSLIYDCESWTMAAETRRRTEAAETGFYCRMLHSPCTDRVCNVEILRRVGRARELRNLIRVRQLQVLGHAIREGTVEDLKKKASKRQAKEGKQRQAKKKARRRQANSR